MLTLHAFIAWNLTLSRYGELKANLHEGLQFYKNINDDAGHFRAKCDDFVLARQMEMQDALSVLQQPEPQQPSPPQMQYVNVCHSLSSLFIFMSIN